METLLINAQLRRWEMNMSEMVVALRWVDLKSGKICGSPTASDAIDYAEQRLKDPGEMACVERDWRMRTCVDVLRVLRAAEGECAACPYTATVDCCRWDPT